MPGPSLAVAKAMRRFYLRLAEVRLLKREREDAMPHEIRVVPADAPIPGRQPGPCLCDWREGLPCPNRATWRVENTTNEGYSEMCTPHKEGFQALEPDALVRYVRVEEDTHAPSP